MRPIEIQIISPMPTSIDFHCPKCNIVMEQVDVTDQYRTDCRDEYPEEWRQHAERLTDCVKNLSRLYKHRIIIKIIDAHSPLGVWKQIRHCVFKFPAFVVDGKQTFTGWDTEVLESLIDRRIQESS